MAYQKKKRKFGREKDVRNAFIRSLVRSLILHEKIVTTEARAKTIRPIVEKNITKARDNSVANRRLLLSRFCNDEVVVKKLLDNLGPRFKERNGGYTRITKVEPRPGSGRSVAVIEFV